MHREATFCFAANNVKILFLPTFCSSEQHLPLRLCSRDEVAPTETYNHLSAVF